MNLVINQLSLRVILRRNYFKHIFLESHCRVYVVGTYFSRFSYAPRMYLCILRALCMSGAPAVCGITARAVAAYISYRVQKCSHFSAQSFKPNVRNKVTKITIKVHPHDGAVYLRIEL